MRRWWPLWLLHRGETDCLEIFSGWAAWFIQGKLDKGHDIWPRTWGCLGMGKSRVKWVPDQLEEPRRAPSFTSKSPSFLIWETGKRILCLGKVENFKEVSRTGLVQMLGSPGQRASGCIWLQILVQASSRDQKPLIRKR